jgi:hypothetical protein
MGVSTLQPPFSGPDGWLFCIARARGWGYGPDVELFIHICSIPNEYLNLPGGN